MLSPERILETERLSVRRFSLDDACGLISILGDKEVMAQTLRSPLTLEEIKTLLSDRIFRII